MKAFYAFFLFLFAAAGMVFVGGYLGFTLAEVAFLGAPVLLVASLRGGMAGIGLVKPRGLDVLGGVLIGSSMWLVLTTFVVSVQERFFPAPPELEQGLRALIVPTVPALVAISLVPAICEELLFRGALGFALDRRFGRAFAVIGSAAAFAALHGSLYRLAPTFLLGLSFGAVALRSGSLVPTMIAHALNNGAIWVATLVPGLEGALDRHVAVAASGALFLACLGHALVFKRPAPSRTVAPM